MGAHVRAVSVCGLFAASVACEPGDRVVSTDAGVRRAEAIASPSLAASAEPAERGCTHSGSLDVVERDPMCVVDGAREDESLRAAKAARMTLDPEAPRVGPGGVTRLKVEVRNPTTMALPLAFEALPKGAAERFDTTLISGIVLDAGARGDLAIPFFVHTLDARRREVDKLRVLLPAGERPRLFRVWLPPGGTLFRQVDWVALRLPAPPPPIELDGGRRITLKTTPRPLPPGEYVLKVAIPLFGLPPEDRIVSTTIKVGEEP